MLLKFTFMKTLFKDLDRSSTTNAAVVMRTRTQFGKRAFSVCGPSIWNQIPPRIRNLHSVPAFAKL